MKPERPRAKPSPEEAAEASSTKDTDYDLFSLPIQEISDFRSDLKDQEQKMRRRIVTIAKKFFECAVTKKTEL